MLKYARQHRTIRISLNGKRVPVDTWISGLIADLWKLGIKTSFSCQGGPPTNPAYFRTEQYQNDLSLSKKRLGILWEAYLAFPTKKDFMKFMSIGLYVPGLCARQNAVYMTQRARRVLCDRVAELLNFVRDYAKAGYATEVRRKKIRVVYPQ